MARTATAGIDLSLSAEELEATRERITSFVAEQVEAAGARGAVMGLSGGIDSTTVAHLAVEALGADALHGLVMPGEVSREDNMSDAERVASDLGIEYDVIEIRPIVEAFLDAYPGARGDEMAVGNARVRTRAVLNYLVANHEDALVLGTGNRTEALVGYFTKYGDGAVDCHPIGCLYKNQVRQLARELGVPEGIVTKTPTAGMWAGQTDEGELGMSYGTLDAILAVAIDGPLSTAAAARLLDGVSIEEIERVRAMYEESAHKRQAPPAPERPF